MAKQEKIYNGELFYKGYEKDTTLVIKRTLSDQNRDRVSVCLNLEPISLSFSGNR